MTRYVVRFDDAALRELDEFATYAAAYSEAWASEQFDRLTAIFSNDLAKHPLRYAFFHVTGCADVGVRSRASSSARASGSSRTSLASGIIPTVNHDSHISESGY